MTAGERRAKHVPDGERAKLWKLAGGVCSFRGCGEDLVYESSRPVFGGHVAHIAGESADGPRGDDPLPIDKRHLYDNLILLCPSHHDEVDSLPDRYSSTLLHQYKAEHEQEMARLRATKRHLALYASDGAAGHAGIVSVRGGPLVYRSDTWRSHRNVSDILDVMLRRGGVVLAPSDGGYGVNVDPTSARQVGLVRTLLIKPDESHVPDPSDPVPVVFSTVAAARKWGTVSKAHARLLADLWPGPLTLLASPRRSSIAARRASKNVSNGSFLAIRQTGSLVEQALAGEAERGLMSMAVRDDAGRIVRNADDAIDIVRSAMEREERFVPLVVVANDRFAYAERSTVVRMAKDEGDIEVVREGAISQKDVRAALLR